MRALLALVCACLLWLPQAALAWSLNVPPGTPTVNTPIGMWYLHPDIHFDNVPGNGNTGNGWPLSFTVPQGNGAAAATLRGQLTRFGFASVGMSGGGLISEGSILMDDGMNYVIQSTPHLKSYGLGFVLQFRTRIISSSRYTIATQTSSWTPVTTIATDICPSDWVAITTNGTQSFRVEVDMDIRIHWIRLAGQNLNTSGSTIPVLSGLNNTRIFNVRLRTGNGGCQDINVPGVGNTIIHQFWQAMHFYRAPVQTCTTPSGEITKNLGWFNAWELPGVGNSTTPQEVTFIVNCPEGYNAIRYWVGSPYRVPTDPPGVVRLNPASTASGVGVKIWDAATSLPIQFGAGNTYTSTTPTYALPEYTVYRGLYPNDPNNPFGNNDNHNQASADWIWERGGPDKPGATENSNQFTYGQPRRTYDIKLKAALYQLEPAITPGPFKTHILIYLVYK